MNWAKYQWDRVAAAVLAVIGLLALLLGYLGISGTVYPAEQLPYIISGGMIGIFCLGTAGVLYLSADMRDEWRKLDELDQTIKDAGLVFASRDPRTPAAHDVMPIPAAEQPTGELSVAAMSPTVVDLERTPKPRAKRAPRTPKALPAESLRATRLRES